MHRRSHLIYGVGQMKTHRKWFPRQFSLRTLLLLTFLCACGARPAARWIEAKRATRELDEVTEREHANQATLLDLAIACRTECQAICAAPFADVSQAMRTYEIELFFVFSARQCGASDFRTPKAEAVRQFLVTEYNTWFDQGFPDHRRDAELQALLVEAIPEATASRQEWVATKKNRPSRKDS
jgi:hypothetical protein